jgi:hypothetical protein
MPQKSAAPQISIFSDVERLLDQKQVGDIAVWQVALCLILCGMPYNETHERSVTRRARLADGSWLTVRFTATGERLEFDKQGEPIIDPATGKQKITPIPLLFGAGHGPLHRLQTPRGISNPILVLVMSLFEVRAKYSNVRKGHRVSKDAGEGCTEWFEATCFDEVKSFVEANRERLRPAINPSGPTP